MVDAPGARALAPQTNPSITRTARQPASRHTLTLHTHVPRVSRVRFCALPRELAVAHVLFYPRNEWAERHVRNERTKRTLPTKRSGSRYFIDGRHTMSQCYRFVYIDTRVSIVAVGFRTRSFAHSAAPEALLSVKTRSSPLPLQLSSSERSSVLPKRFAAAPSACTLGFAFSRYEKRPP